MDATAVVIAHEDCILVGPLVVHSDTEFTLAAICVQASSEHKVERSYLPAIQPFAWTSWHTACSSPTTWWAPKLIDQENKQAKLAHIHNVAVAVVRASLAHDDLNMTHEYVRRLAWPTMTSH
eukprot:784538-Amphidinium_carterae.1